MREREPVGRKTAGASGSRLPALVEVVQRTLPDRAPLRVERAAPAVKVEDGFPPSPQPRFRFPPFQRTRVAAVMVSRENPRRRVARAFTSGVTPRRIME